MGLNACEEMTEKLAVVEHAWKNHDPIHWEETLVLDHGRGPELLVKEVLHIQINPRRSASTEMEDWKSLDAGSQ